MTYCTSTTFRILVSDVDDNRPKFDLKVFSVSVPENLDVGDHIVRARAQDPDSTSVLYYTMIGNISAEHFTINNMTGTFFYILYSILVVPAEFCLRVLLDQILPDPTGAP